MFNIRTVLNHGGKASFKHSHRSVWCEIYNMCSVNYTTTVRPVSVAIQSCPMRAGAHGRALNGEGRACSVKRLNE